MRIFNNASEAFIGMMRDIYHIGDNSKPRGMEIKELINYSIKIKNPDECIVNTPFRKSKKKYLAEEFIWYCSGDQSKKGSDYICKAAPFWNTLRNDDGSLNSNYGYYYWYQDINGITQFEYCKELLRKDKDTRQAVININNITHKKHLKDTPCTVNLQFLINKDTLDMIVNMRSCDIILGYCNDVFQFSLMQMCMATELGIQQGSLMFNFGSLHVYERHFEIMRNTATYEGEIEQSEKFSERVDNECVKILAEVPNITESDIIALMSTCENKAVVNILEWAYM